MRIPRGGKIAAMPYLKTDDRARIYYEEHGTGTPLVLAYGIGGNATMWDVNVPGLAARHRLILWEPRGHARSDSPDDPAKYSFKRWALDLGAVLDHLSLRRAHVGGLSLGAGIATRFALRFPRRVRSLVITNSSSASGLPLSWQNVVMRARSIEVTLTQGMDAMAEFAMTANSCLPSEERRGSSLIVEPLSARRPARRRPGSSCTRCSGRGCPRAPP